MSDFFYDIAIIGGGASGLVASISAKRSNPKLSVAVFESNQRVGKKLLTTGNGRCNLGNSGDLFGRYHGDVAFAKRVLTAFDTEKTLEFFRSIGVECIELEEEKLYPMCLQAGGVVDQLRFTADDLGIDCLTEHKVLNLRHKGNTFEITTEKGIFSSKKVIVATGGCAASKSGSRGDGYDFLCKFGHKKSPIFPAIVQITTKTDLTKALSGIKFDGEITVVSKGISNSQRGEILFTDYGLSGPPVMQLSRIISEQGKADVILDLLPNLTFEQVFSIIERRKEILKFRTADHLLLGFLNKRLGERVVKSCDISLSSPISSLSARDMKEITAKIKKFPLIATGTKGFENAQVTAGGISAHDFNFDTLESKLQKGLYATGEVLNVDGDCGGFNLQWAWATGYIAGKSAAE